MSEKVKRRLTTILCADAEGYSRLMEADEQATLAGLRRHRAAMAALVERHDGRIVNTWGDAVIAEFGSVVEAVQCATEIQQELAGLDSDRLDSERLLFRIGINLGDVMVDGDDIYGDGVNVAARLQEMAEPGGILISGQVYEQVRNKLPIGFELIGDQHVKNIETPVVSYRVTQGPEGSAGAGLPPRPSAAAPPPARRPTRRLPRPIAALLVLAAFLVLVNVFDGLEFGVVPLAGSRHCDDRRPVGRAAPGNARQVALRGPGRETCRRGCWADADLPPPTQRRVVGGTCRRWSSIDLSVMAGLDGLTRPSTRTRMVPKGARSGPWSPSTVAFTWMAGSSPAMTEGLAMTERSRPFRERRFVPHPVMPALEAGIHADTDGAEGARSGPWSPSTVAFADVAGSSPAMTAQAVREGRVRMGL